MASIHPYLNLNGNTEEVFEFYRSVFGGEFAMIMRFKDAPPEACGGPEEANKIMHIALPIGGGTILMASDIPSNVERSIEGTNISLTIGAESKEEADRIFNGLSDGGQVFMPMGKTFWGAYFGMLKDKFNIHWMVSFDENTP